MTERSAEGMVVAFYNGHMVEVIEGLRAKSKVRYIDSAREFEVRTAALTGAGRIARMEAK